MVECIKDSLISIINYSIHDIYFLPIFIQIYFTVAIQKKITHSKAFEFLSVTLLVAEGNGRVKILTFFTGYPPLSPIW